MICLKQMKDAILSDNEQSVISNAEIVKSNTKTTVFFYPATTNYVKDSPNDTSKD